MKIDLLVYLQTSAVDKKGKLVCLLAEPVHKKHQLVHLIA